MGGCAHSFGGRRCDALRDVACRGRRNRRRGEVAGGSGGGALGKALDCTRLRDDDGLAAVRGARAGMAVRRQGDMDPFRRVVRGGLRASDGAFPRARDVGERGVLGRGGDGERCGRSPRPTVRRGRSPRPTVRFACDAACLRGAEGTADAGKACAENCRRQLVPLQLLAAVARLRAEHAGRVERRSRAHRAPPGPSSAPCPRVRVRTVWREAGDRDVGRCGGPGN